MTAFEIYVILAVQFFIGMAVYHIGVKEGEKRSANRRSTTSLSG